MSEMNTNPTSNLLGEALRSALKDIVKEAIQEAIRQVTYRTDKQLGPVDPYLTIKEAAGRARLAPSTIRLYIRKGKLKAATVGRRVIIRQEDLKAFIDGNS